MSKLLKKPIMILVGAKPSSDPNQHPGGQMTASLGLLEYAKSVGIELKVIDTTQSSFPVPPFRKRLLKGGVRVLELLRLLMSKPVYGVVVFSSAGFSLYERTFLCLIARSFAVSTLLFIRDGHFMERERNTKGWSGVTRLCLRFPSFIGSQGDSWSNLYNKLGVSSERLVHVRNWLPPHIEVSTRPKKLEQNQRLRFVFVGWVVPEKGIDYLTQAIDTLAAEYDFEFVFVGGGSGLEACKEKYKKYASEVRVRFTGWLKPDQVKEELRLAHVFVLPSLAEGFPNSLLEAFAFGLPAICTNVGSISDSLISGQNGFLITPGSSSEIYSAMKTYLDNPGYVEAHSEKSLQMVKLHHNFDSNCKELFGCFEKK